MVPGALDFLRNKRARALSKQMLNATGMPQMASDAYWSFTNPVDRLLGRGRAADPQMEIPFGPVGAMATVPLRGSRARLAMDAKRAEEARLLDWPTSLPEYTPNAGSGFYRLVPEDTVKVNSVFGYRIPMVQNRNTFVVGAAGRGHAELLRPLGLGGLRKPGDNATNWTQWELIAPRPLKGVKSSKQTYDFSELSPKKAYKSGAELEAGYIQPPLKWDDLIRNPANHLRMRHDARALRNALAKQMGREAAQRMTRPLFDFLESGGEKGFRWKGSANT